MRSDGVRIWCVALGIGPPKEDVLVTDCKVKGNLAIRCLVRVCCMSRKCIRGTKPLHDCQLEVKGTVQGGSADLDIFAGCIATRQYSNVERNVGIPLPVLAASLHSFKVTCLWYDWEDDL